MMIEKIFYGDMLMSIACSLIEEEV